MNQAKHHQSEIFKHEYIRMLKEFDVDYDEKYLFDAAVLVNGSKKETALISLKCRKDRQA